MKSGKVGAFVGFAQGVEAYWGYLEEHFPGTYPPKMLERLRWIMKKYDVGKARTFNVLDPKIADMIEEMSKLHPLYRSKK